MLFGTFFGSDVSYVAMSSSTSAYFFIFFTQNKLLCIVTAQKLCWRDRGTMGNYFQFLFINNDFRGTYFRTPRVESYYDISLFEVFEHFKSQKCQKSEKMQKNH